MFLVRDIFNAIFFTGLALMMWQGGEHEKIDTAPDAALAEDLDSVVVDSVIVTDTLITVGTSKERKELLINKYAAKLQ